LKKITLAEKKEKNNDKKLSLSSKCATYESNEQVECVEQVLGL